VRLPWDDWRSSTSRRVVASSFFVVSRSCSVLASCCVAVSSSCCALSRSDLSVIGPDRQADGDERQQRADPDPAAVVPLTRAGGHLVRELGSLHLRYTLACGRRRSNTASRTTARATGTSIAAKVSGALRAVSIADRTSTIDVASIVPRTVSSCCGAFAPGAGARLRVAASATRQTYAATRAE